MAVVRERCQLNLRIPVADLSDGRSRFPLPVPPNSAASGTSVSSSSISTADLEKLRVLGHGNGGTVYKVRHKPTNTVYALKVIHGNSDRGVHLQVFREMEILRQT